MLPVPPKLEPLLKRYQIDPAEIRVVKCIGGGSFGEVYVAVMDGKTCAVKQLPPFEEQTDWFYFLREIATVATVNHPAVLPLIGFVPDPEKPAIVSDYAKNGTLDDVRQQKEEKRRLPLSLHPGRVARIFYGVASALASAHRVKVLHRDVKPANIFLSPTWEPWLGDFGCARFASEENWFASRSGGNSHSDKSCTAVSLSDTVGTPIFRAPELLRNEKHYDHKVDVYAFGMTVMLLFAPEDDLRQMELENGLKCTNDTLVSFFAAVSEGKRFKQPKSVPDHYWNIVEACMRPDASERAEFTEVMAMMEKPEFVDRLEKRYRSVFLEYVEDLKKRTSAVAESSDEDK